MQVRQEIKLSRLVIAVLFTVLMADTMPHPNLSPGILAHSLAWMQQGQDEAPVTEAALINSRQSPISR